MSESTVTATGDDLTEAMRDVVDPELGINVVDLGLVYGITVDEANTAIIDMTLTSAACRSPTSSRTRPKSR
jgi:metal-sulfur cluster biosynthetic enzyme